MDKTEVAAVVRLFDKDTRYFFHIPEPPSTKGRNQLLGILETFLFQDEIQPWQVVNATFNGTEDANLLTHLKRRLRRRHEEEVRHFKMVGGWPLEPSLKPLEQDG